MKFSAAIVLLAALKVVSAAKHSSTGTVITVPASSPSANSSSTTTGVETATETATVTIPIVTTITVGVPTIISTTVVTSPTASATNKPSSGNALNAPVKALMVAGAGAVVFAQFL
ncbi:hypothetical protein EDD21DRAFT_364509 [Dissophora ornata]|nr:hypothetical protein BGZ58_008285 [Dissophora ornata]KAI8605103.1 hypothetical protein EDD21DRAFT_364509 [Dissophora ornata]